MDNPGHRFQTVFGWVRFGILRNKLLSRFWFNINAPNINLDEKIYFLGNEDNSIK